MNVPAYPHQDALNSAEVCKSPPDADRLSVSADYTRNCRTNPSEGTILPSSQTYLATPSCEQAAPSPPRGAPTRAARRSASASPWASPGTAPACSRCRRASPLSSRPCEGRGSSRSRAGSRRPDRSNDGTRNTYPARTGSPPSCRNPLQVKEPHQAAHRRGRLPQTRRPDGRPSFAGPGHSNDRMTLAIYTRATDGTQDSPTVALEVTFLDPAVDKGLR